MKERNERASYSLPLYIYIKGEGQFGKKTRRAKSLLMTNARRRFSSLFRLLFFILPFPSSLIFSFFNSRRCLLDASDVDKNHVHAKAIFSCIDKYKHIEWLSFSSTRIVNQSRDGYENQAGEGEKNESIYL